MEAEIFLVLSGKDIIKYSLPIAGILDIYYRSAFHEVINSPTLFKKNLKPPSKTFT